MTEQYFSEYNESNPVNQMKASAGVAYIKAIKTV